MAFETQKEDWEEVENNDGVKLSILIKEYEGRECHRRRNGPKMNFKQFLFMGPTQKIMKEKY